MVNFFSSKKIGLRREDWERTRENYLFIMKVLQQATTKCFDRFLFHQDPVKWYDAEVKAFIFKWRKWFLAIFDLCLMCLWSVLSSIFLYKLFLFTFLQNFTNFWEIWGTPIARLNRLFWEDSRSPRLLSTQTPFLLSNKFLPGNISCVRVLILCQDFVPVSDFAETRKLLC